MAIKLILLLAFFACMIGVGIYCRRSAADVHGFVLGGRSVGPWLTAFAYGTSYFSAVIFIGYAGQFGWKYGLASTWIGLGNAFIGSLLAWVILGRRTRLMTQKLDSKTMPAFFGSRFSSPALKIAASVIVFIFMIPYTASLFNGLSRLFKMAFGIDYVWCVLMMAVLTGIYVVVGGYMATAINDFIQGIIMLFGIVIVILAVLRTNGGFTAALSTLSSIPAETNPSLSGAFVSFFGPQPLSLLGVVILTSLGTWGLPQMIGKFYAIKSEADIGKGTLISTLFAIIVAGGCYFLGGFGRLYGSVIEYADSGAPKYDSIIPTMLEGLPNIVIAIVVILVLSASMSTLSSLVLTSSSTLTLDSVREEKALRKEPDDHHPRPHRVLHRHLRRDRHRAAHLLRHLYRAADGRIVGCACRGIPRALPLQSLQQEDHQSGGLGKLHLRCRTDDGKPHLHPHRRTASQRVPLLTDQRGSACDGRRTCRGAAGQPVHKEAGQRDGGRDLHLL